MNQKNILILLIPTFLVVLAWVGVTVYHSSVDSTISADLSRQIIPIDPNFNQETIEKLEQRKKILPEFGIITTEESSSSAATNQEEAASSSAEPVTQPEILATQGALLNE